MTATVAPPTLCPNTHKDIMYCPCQRCTDHWRTWAEEAVKPALEWLFAPSDTLTEANCTQDRESIIVLEHKS